jgi:hypothetical protein
MRLLPLIFASKPERELRSLIKKIERWRRDVIIAKQCDKRGVVCIYLSMMEVPLILLYVRNVLVT